MRYAILTLCLAECLLPQEIGSGAAGSITIHNGDAAEVHLRLADTPDCFAGLQADLGPNTTRSFDIAEEAYLCVGPDAKGGMRVQDGVDYEVRGGAARVR